VNLNASQESKTIIKLVIWF